MAKSNYSTLIQNARRLAEFRDRDFTTHRAECVTCSRRVLCSIAQSLETKRDAAYSNWQELRQEAKNSVTIP